MDHDDAERIIRAILEGEKLLEKCDHFWDRGDGRNYTPQDADWIMRRHTITGEPEWNGNYGNYEIRLDGKTLDGRLTRVILGLREVGPCALISIITLRTGRKKK